MASHSWSLHLGRPRQDDHNELEASLGHRMETVSENRQAIRLRR